MKGAKIYIGGVMVRDRKEIASRHFNWRSPREYDFNELANGMLISTTRRQAKTRKFIKTKLSKKNRLRGKKLMLTGITNTDAKKTLDWILL